VIKKEQNIRNWPQT